MSNSRALAEKYLRNVRHSNKFMFTLIDRLFYEPFETRYKHSNEYIDLVTELSKESSCKWRIAPEGLWLHVHPYNAPQSDGEAPKLRKLPVQGWKVHISSTIANDFSILTKAAKVAFAKEVSFKCAKDKNVLSLMGSKAWPRGRSGKFMTMYPSDLECFTSLINALYLELRNEEGPYILSDKRYKDCRVLYYRYGGIEQNNRLNVTGLESPVLITPDGELVPDVRTPYFAPPPWATDPFPSQDEAQSEITLNDGRFIVKEALAFSNSGGVYLAEDRDTGKDVVIKEARAHTLMDGKGNDSVILLRREHAILEEIRDTGIAAKPLAFFQSWENFFLAEEYVTGTSPREIMLTQTPLMREHPSLEDSKRYYEVFRKFCKSLAERLSVLHERGIAFGDLSHTNLKVVDESIWTVRFFDFEGAFRMGVDNPTFLYTPGYKSESSIRKEAVGIAEDLYSLAAIMLYMVFPISAIGSLREDLFDSILRTILSDVGWSQTEVFNIISGLAKNEMTCARACELLDAPAEILPPKYNEDIDVDTCDRISQGLGRFVLATMRPDDKDGLFPADPFMQRTNNLNWGFGACGVLHSLKKCGFEIPERAHEWLGRQLDDVKPAALPPGLLTGAAGIAWCLWELGLEDRAIEMMKVANKSPLLKGHHSYYYGMAGIGMANLHMYIRTKGDEYLDMARNLAEALAQTAKESDRGLYWEYDEVVQLGFGYGQSGVALYFLRLFELTGDQEFLAKGKRALEFDLSHGAENTHGGTSFPATPEEETLLSFLEEGGAGIAKVAIRYDMWDCIEGVWSTLHRKYAGFAGVLYGLGSFADALADAYVFSGERTFLEMTKRPLAGVRDLYLIERPSGLATPGDGLFRVTCDYVTGTTGLMRTFYRCSHFDEADFFLDEVGLVAGRRVDVVAAGEVQRQAVSST